MAGSRVKRHALRRVLHPKYGRQIVQLITLRVPSTRRGHDCRALQFRSLKLLPVASIEDVMRRSANGMSCFAEGTVAGRINGPKATNNRKRN